MADNNDVPQNMLVTIHEDMPKASIASDITAPSDGEFVAYLFTRGGRARGSIKAEFRRGSTVLWSSGCSVDVSDSSNVPYGAFSYSARSGDKMSYEIDWGHNVHGGIGFNSE